MRIWSVTLAGLFLLIAGCDQEMPSPRNQTDDTLPVRQQQREPIDPNLEAALLGYHAEGRRLIEASMACVANMQRAAGSFLDQPTDTGLRDLTEQTRHCHQQYQATVALTSGHEALESRMTSLRYRIDSRPINPGFVDYVENYPDSGIVNDPALPLTAQNLIAEQGLTDSADAALGFEVLLFLLQGERRYKPSLAPRPVTDFLPATEWPIADTSDMLPISEHPTHRRRRYFMLATDMLAHDLDLLSRAWGEWKMPPSGDAARSLLFSIVRNWHSVAASLPAEDSGAVTVLLINVLQPSGAGGHKNGGAISGIAAVAALQALDGWPQDGQEPDPARIVQAVGNWLNQHYN